ncbi:MAG: site-2 protease family protein [Oscillospiraceae bacterium]|nr:site-2 protease family protein [Oscillospiraceae bacterium]
MALGIVGRIRDLFSGLNWLIIPAALLAIIFHEISHGYVAYLLGDRTAKNSGRLTLNPIQHMEPLGLLCMILFGFGWAKPVPVNPYFFKNRKLGMALVSIAGPVSNLLMAVLSMSVILAVSLFDIESRALLGALNVVLEFFLVFAILNIGLAVFNLIPIPPLDGSKILFSLLPRRAYGFILKYERWGMLLLLVLVNVPFFTDFLTYIREMIFTGIINMLSAIFY